MCESVEEGFPETEIKIEEMDEDVLMTEQGQSAGGGGGGGENEDENGNENENDDDDDDESPNMDDVEIEYLEEKYLNDFDDEEDEDEEVEVEVGVEEEEEEERVEEVMANEDREEMGSCENVEESEEHILIKSEGETTTAVLLPKGIKVEEAWEVEGDDVAFMFVGSDCDEVLEHVIEDKGDEGSEDVVICNFCEKPIRSNNLEEHLRLIHTFKYCDLCKTEVKEKFFKAHMKSHEESKVFCELCNKLVKKQDFIKHCKKHQGFDAIDRREKVNRKVCDICGYQVEGKGTLNKHMREKHDEGQNYCDLCEKYVWIKCYDKHIKDVHEDHEDFCKTCSKWFKYYKTHMRTSHKDVVKFCDYCQVDVEAHTLENHMATVHSKQSRFCETCNKEFFEFVCYKNHVRNIHLKVKSYKCSECDFTTAYRTSMDKHILGTHTRNQKYVCEICAKEFIVKDNLRKHIRMIHNGQQKSVCTYCGKVCHANRELINHVRLHTGDLPYQCEFCLRKFPKKWTLDNHRRIHTGEKPYKCTHCDSAFGTSAQMKIHEFREHGVEKYRHVDRAGKRRKMENIFGV